MASESKTNQELFEIWSVSLVSLKTKEWRTELELFKACVNYTNYDYLNNLRLIELGLILELFYSSIPYQKFDQFQQLLNTKVW